VLTNLGREPNHNWDNLHRLYYLWAGGGRLWLLPCAWGTTGPDRSFTDASWLEKALVMMSFFFFFFSFWSAFVFVT
jgi:hypothetical protein